jgi:hypothetical protein
LSGSLTPHLHECLVRLGVWIPSFEEAGKLLKVFTGANVSEPTVRRQTEEAGAAYVAWQDEEVERIERELPPAPPGSAKELLSVDGALVPLLHGEWAEVKTLVIGEIQEAVKKKDEWVVHTGQLSYFSRLTDSDTFCRLALGETHRRGLENAGKVAAVTDGAEWEQGFIDFHRYDAVRILDFPHAAERISQVGDVIFGEGTAGNKDWFKEQVHELKHEGPSEVLAELRALQKEHPDVSVLAENLAYLEKRERNMQYPMYQAEGLPIGSGAVESGNKLVVEARLKGAGMHWERSHVNPMLALRNVVCSDRWDEAWPQIAARLRRDAAQSKAQRRAQGQAKAIPPQEAPSPTMPAAEKEAVYQESPSPVLPTQPVSSSPAGKKSPYRPSPNHPWRRSPIGRARYQPNNSTRSTKT